MAVSDILEKIGEGAKTAGRVAGAVAPALGKSIINEEAGYAPQIAAEGRAHQQKLEDAQLAAKEQELTSQLEMGRHYGTLTDDQQRQYVQAITNLYSHPRHAGTLMEKLRQAVHPNGAIAQPAPKLASATPAGGTAEEDARIAAEKIHPRPVPGVHPFKGPDGKYYQPMYDAHGNISNEEIQGYTPEQKGAGKSPPITGDKLPADAVGADGEPISADLKNAGKSFVEYQGKWWPVAKPKPVFKTVKGHSVLVDAQSGAILRDLGPTGTAKITTRQTLQPGDDNQMYLVNLTSVTTPEGAQIDVEPDMGEGEGGAAKPFTTPTAQPKSKGVGGILKPSTPSTPARPVTAHPGGVGGRVVPGLSTLARSKNPLFKADASSYKKANDDLITKKEAYESAQKALASGSTASSDQELIYSWVRSNVQGAGRMTQAEFKLAAATGSLPLRAQSAWERTKSGRLPPELEQMFLGDIKRSYETANQIVGDLRKNLEPGNAAPSQSNVIVVSPEDMR